MRLLMSLAMASSIAAAPAYAAPLKKSGQSADCPSASGQFTRKNGIWSEDPVKPKKLAELPPAESFATVYRLDERGCMVPVKFRDVRR